MRSQKVLIRTLPTGNGNYGGILQAYALQRTIRALGFSAETDISVPPTMRGRLARALLPAKRVIFKSPWTQQEAERASNRRLDEFVQNQMATVRLYGLRRSPRRRIVRRYDSFVVGSDQVWRPEYGDLSSYLLDFLADGFGGRRLTYAASFGTDDPSPSGKEALSAAKHLASRLEKVSVREVGGLVLAKNLWGIEAVQHVDPTLLLTASDYAVLIEAVPTESARGGGVASYILDRTELADALIEVAIEQGDVMSTDLSPRRPRHAAEYRESPEAFDKVSIERWLRTIRDANLLLTDSFHGCVFAILFHTPFLVIPNSQRGLARFASLLGMFGLEQRMVIEESDVAKALDLGHEPIDWDRIDSILAAQRVRSLEYLTSGLR